MRSMWALFEERPVEVAEVEALVTVEGALVRDGRLDDAGEGFAGAGGSGRNPFVRIFSVVASTLAPFFWSSHLIAARGIWGNIPETSSARELMSVASAGVGARRGTARVLAELD